jgi:glycosyltransferase involved in cell wall biosynthesis
MKIAATVHQFPPGFETGTEILCLRTAQALKARGHTLRVFTADPTLNAGRPPRLDRVEDIEVVRIPSRRPRRVTLTRRLSDEFQNPAAQRWLLDSLRSFRPDLIHGYQAQQLGLAVLPELAGLAPLVLTATDFHLACPLATAAYEDGSVCDGPRADGTNCLAHVEAREARRLEAARRTARIVLKARTYAGQLALTMDNTARRRAMARARYLASEAALASASLILAGSARIRDMLVRSGAHPDCAEVLPHAAPPTHVPDKVAGGPLHVSFLGTIAPHKGPHVLLDAIARIPRDANVVFTICGPAGPDAAYTNGIARRASSDPRITLLPPVPNARFGQLIGDADVVVVPSLWDENSPLTLLTALEAGRFVVTSDTPGLAADVKAPDGGDVFAAGDDGALADIITKLASDRSRINEVRRTPVRRPAFASYIDALELRYEQALARRAVAAGRKS